MPDNALSRIDLNILKNLKQDGRVSSVELARRVGLTTTPCKERVKRLERDGFILGYHADVSPEKLGFSVIIFAFVGLSSQSETDLLAFENVKKVNIFSRLMKSINYLIWGDV